jgi:hypothetical protein
MTIDEIVQLADSVQFMGTVKEIEAAYTTLRAWNDNARHIAEAIADGTASPDAALQFVGTSCLTDRIITIGEAGKMPAEYKAAIGYLKRQQARGASHFFDREIEDNGNIVPNTMFMAFGVLVSEVEKLRRSDRLMALGK